MTWTAPHFENSVLSRIIFGRTYRRVIAPLTILSIAAVGILTVMLLVICSLSVGSYLGQTVDTSGGIFLVMMFVLLTVISLVLSFVAKYAAERQFEYRYDAIERISRRLRSLPAQKKRTPGTSYNLSKIINDGDTNRDEQLQYFNYFHGDNYRYGEMSYSSFDTLPIRTRDRYKSYINFCSVVVVEMKKKIPDFIFDSPFLDGLQFIKYANNSISGGVTGYFIDRKDPSLHQSKTWDILSRMPDCDIEIDSRQLYVYAPLLDTESIPDFIHNAKRLADALEYDFGQTKRMDTR